MTDVKNNPLLERLKIPGETFRLPSQGLFYDNGELSEDVKNGEVHVHPMTAIDELVFRSPDMLFTGKAIEEVFSRCIPQVAKPVDLLAKDIDYLLACLRLVTYGPTLTVEYTHECTDAKSHEYEIQVRPLIQQARSIDPTTLNTNYVVKMENGQVVKVRPTLFRTVLELSQATDLGDKIPSLDEVKRSMLAVITDIIDNIDGIDNHEQIAEWVTQAPAGWIRKISDMVEKTGDWGVDFSVKSKCKDCGEDIELMIGTNPISLFL